MSRLTRDGTAESVSRHQIPRHVRGQGNIYFSCSADHEQDCTYSKSMDQPGKVANPAQGQLNRENEYFPVRHRAGEFGVARQVRQSRPASACSSPYILRLNQAESGAYLRDSSRVPLRRPWV